MDYSKLLIKIRASLNLSQQELANKIGVAFATVNRWENKKAIPSKKHIYIIGLICKENNILTVED